MLLWLMSYRYGVVVDGERGNRPNIVAQEDLLRHTVCFVTVACSVLTCVSMGPICHTKPPSESNVYGCQAFSVADPTV